MFQQNGIIFWVICRGLSSSCTMTRHSLRPTDHTLKKIPRMSKTEACKRVFTDIQTGTSHPQSGAHVALPVKLLYPERNEREFFIFEALCFCGLEMIFVKQASYYDFPSTCDVCKDASSGKSTCTGVQSTPTKSEYAF